MTSLNFKALLLAEKKRLLHQSVAVEPATTDVVLDELPLDLSQHVVDDTAKQVFYVPNFLNDNDVRACERVRGRVETSSVYLTCVYVCVCIVCA